MATNRWIHKKHFLWIKRKVCSFKSISDNHKCDKIPQLLFIRLESWAVCCRSIHCQCCSVFVHALNIIVLQLLHRCAVEKVQQNVYVLLGLFIYLIFHRVLFILIWVNSSKRLAHTSTKDCTLAHGKEIPNVIITKTREKQKMCTSDKTFTS